MGRVAGRGHRFDILVHSEDASGVDGASVCGEGLMPEKVLQVLLVEDDDDHAEIVTRGLANSSVTSLIHRVSNGEAALDYVFRRGPYADPDLSPEPGVILLDLRLPVMDGIEVLRSIKQAPEVSNIPVVMLTTSNAPVDIVSAYKNHANSYLVKPTEFVDVNEMAQALSTYWLTWNSKTSEKTSNGGSS